MYLIVLNDQLLNPITGFATDNKKRWLAFRSEILNHQKSRKTLLQILPSGRFKNKRFMFLSRYIIIFYPWAA